MGFCGFRISVESAYSFLPTKNLLKRSKITFCCDTVTCYIRKGLKQKDPTSKIPESSLL